MADFSSGLFPKYRHILWDWNGTLLDDRWLAVETINGMLGRRGMQLIGVEDYLAHFDFPVVDYYRRLGFDFQREAFEVVAHEFIADYESRRFECRLHPDALPALESAREARMPQSLLSATRQDSLFQFVDFFGLAAYFEELAGLSDHYAHGKVERGRLWLRHQELDPADVLMIGDTRHDHEVAAALGMDCLLVAHGHQPRVRLEACGAPVYDSLKEIFHHACP